MKSRPVMLHLFVLCSVVLDLSTFAQGLHKDVDNTEPSFGLIKKAKEDNKFRRDGVKTKYDLRSVSLYPHAQNTQKPKKSKRPKRAAMSNKSRLWMDANGRPLIPYVIEPNNFADHTKRTIHMAMRRWTKHVPCLRFVQRTNQRSYISFYAGEGCFSDVGRMGGRQRISIGQGCGLLTTIIHEIGHALGFWHEQSRPDRDRYVRIYWRNIQPEFKYAFEKYDDGRINSLGVPYDYDSIMHYRSTAFGQGRTTIARINGDKRLSNKRGLSPADIKQARLLYCEPPTSPPRPATRPPTGCSHRDFSSTCSYWARRGFCSSSSSHYSKMLKYCKKTCFCSKRSVVCKDKNQSCAYWSKLGYCRTRTTINYMRINCKKSCRLCTVHNTRRI